MFGCVGFIFLSIVELAMVGALEKTEKQAYDMQDEEDDAASYSRRSFQRKQPEVKTVIFPPPILRPNSNMFQKHRLRRMESPSAGSTDWKNSMWSRLNEGTTFIECPQPGPPTSNSNPEVEEPMVPASPDSQSSKPSAFKFRTSARAVMWMKKSIRKKPPKPQAPKLFDKWSGEDLDL